jgi:hypothetical protein
MCAVANNVVAVAKEASTTTQITRSSVRAEEHVEAVRAVSVGAVVAAHSKKEPEAWFLGVVVKTLYKPNATFVGHRRERVEEGEWHVEIRKLHEAIAGKNQYERIDGDEGLLHVPAECVVLTDVTVVTNSMSRTAAKDAIGEEWDTLPRGTMNAILRSPYMYLPKPERERVWLNCPK